MVKKKRWRKKIKAMMGNRMEKLSEDEIREILKEYPKVNEFFTDIILKLQKEKVIFINEKFLDRIENCMQKLRNIPSLKNRIAQIKKNKIEFKTFQWELKEASYYANKEFQEIEFIPKTKNKKTPDFRVRIDEEWIYFEVTSFMNFPLEVKFQDFEEELYNVISHYDINIIIQDEIDYNEEMIAEIKNIIMKELKMKIENGTIGGCYSPKSFVKFEIDYKEEKSPTLLSFPCSIDIKLNSKNDKYSPIILDVIADKKGQFKNLQKNIPKVIALYSTNLFLGAYLESTFRGYDRYSKIRYRKLDINLVQLSKKFTLDYFNNPEDSDILAIILNMNDKRYVLPNYDFFDKKRLEKLIPFLM